VVNVTDEELARAIIADVGGNTPSAELIAMFTRVGEWGQVGTQALVDVAHGHGVVRPELVREAIDRWPNDMGGLLQVFEPMAA